MFHDDRPQSHIAEMEAVIDNLPNAIIVVDRDRRVRLANKQALIFSGRVSKEEFFGLRGGEAFGCVNAAKSPDGCGYAPECAFCRLRRAVLEAFEARCGRVGTEAEMTVEGLGPVPLRVSTNFLEPQGRELVILAIEDIREQKLQEQLRFENERYRAAMATAGAVCHEMNQPLMALTALAGLLMVDGAGGKPTREHLQAIEDQAVQLGRITRKLMHLKSYETKEYAGGDLILDIEKATRAAPLTR